jgi:hypothetical protein
VFTAETADQAAYAIQYIDLMVATKPMASRIIAQLEGGEKMPAVVFALCPCLSYTRL